MVWNDMDQLIFVEKYLFVGKTKARGPRSTDITEVPDNGLFLIKVFLSFLKSTA